MFIHLPEPQCHKLEARATKFIFDGYETNHKGYRCYDPYSKKITITLDSDFFENTFYYQPDRQGESRINNLSLLTYPNQSFPSSTKLDDGITKDQTEGLRTSSTPQVPCQIVIPITKTPSEIEHDEVINSEPNTPSIETLNAIPTIQEEVEPLQNPPTPLRNSWGIPP